ncbi:MAG: PAS domain S-box protein, partial [Acidobacteriota bacterium]|nr:PAS domain S-box protein [Acidobacteriota bacterium]
MKLSRPAPVVLAPLSVGLALALRLALNPLVGLSAPYAAFIVALAVSGVFGSLTAGLIAMLLGAVAAAYFLVPPLHTFVVHGAQNQLTFAGYLLVSGAILALIEMQHRQKSKLSAEVDRRQKAEAAERALRERFEITLASIGEGVISTDPQGCVTFMNEVASSLTGWAVKEAAGQPLESVFKPRPEESGAILASRLGSEHFIEETTAPIRDSSGRQSGAVVVVRDTTALRERDAAVQRAGRESENLFRTLADSIPQLAWMAHPGGHIFWYNRRWYEYTGATPAQMEGWGWQSVHDPERLPAVMKQWMQSIETGEPFDMVFPLRGADGVYRSFLTLIMPVRDDQGNVVRWFGTNTDITERQKIEDRLRASDERFRHLYEADVVGIMCVDTERVFEANDVFLRMLGYSRDDLLGGGMLWRDLSAPEYLAADERMFARIIADGSAKPWEKELLHKDGHSVPILVGATLLQREPPQCLCVI